MGALIISVFVHAIEGVIAPILLQISYGIVELLSGFMLSAFKFSTLQEVVINLPGLEGADNALLFMAFGLAIILFAFGIYQYFLSPQGAKEGAMAQIFRFAIVCFFIGNATLVIEKVLSVTYKLYTLALNANTGETPLKGESFTKLMDALKNPDHSILGEAAEGAVNAVLNWNIFSMLIEAIFLLILVCYVIKLWLKMFERYVNFIVELYLFPVTVSFMANVSMQDVFFTYLRAIVSQYMILLINIFFIKVALYNIVNGFFLVLLNETNIFQSFFFSVAFVKIGLKAEELIQTWGLFGMSAGTVLDDARNVLGVMRDGAMFMGGSMSGKGMVGGTAKAMASAISNSRLGSFIDKHGLGSKALRGAIGGAIGAKSGFQNGSGIYGKLKNAVTGGAKGIGTWSKGGSKQLAKELMSQHKAGTAVQNAALQRGASFNDAKKLGKQAVNAMRNMRTISTAGDIKKPTAPSNSLQSMAKNLCASSANGFVSKKMISAAATQKKKDLTRSLNPTQAMSLVGANAAGSKSLGTCIGGTYNAATGTTSLNFVKTKENGEKEYTKATAVPFNTTTSMVGEGPNAEAVTTSGYSDQINKAIDSSGLKFTESISDDGQKWAIIQNENMPSQIMDEMDSRLSKANTTINEDLQGANDTIKKHNSTQVETILATTPEKLIKCDEDGLNIQYCGERSDLSAEAFRDYISNNNLQTSSNKNAYDLDEAAKIAFQDICEGGRNKLKEYWKDK